MLKLLVPVVELVDRDISRLAFKGWVYEARYFTDRSVPDVQIYRKSHDSKGLMAPMVSVPASIFPGHPDRNSGWTEYVMANLDLIYDYLLENNIRLH